jgi:3-oxoadipate enol-lactonase
MALHAEDLASLLDVLDIKEAHIGGTSYGAEISMVFALKYPERAKSLIVTSAVSQVDPQLEGMIGSWVTAARTKDPELFFQAVYPVTFSDPWIADNWPVLEQARERYKQLDFEAMVELLSCFSRLDITSDLHRIKCPTLVVVGENDLLKPRKYSELIASEIPGAELAVIPHAGHAALWERADLFNTLILGFLAKQMPMQ